MCEQKNNIKQDENKKGYLFPRQPFFIYKNMKTQIVFNLEPIT